MCTWRKTSLFKTVVRPPQNQTYFLTLEQSSCISIHSLSATVPYTLNGEDNNFLFLDKTTKIS